MKINNKKNIHDKSYKDLFSNKDTFINLIQSFVNDTWGAKLTKENLELVDKSYVLSDYEEQESDIVYKAKLGSEEVFFYILLEFQSSVDYRMPIRLLLYMIEIWREILKNTEYKQFRRKTFRLPSVVPIVLYNGNREWTAARRLKEVISNSELFGDNILDFRYSLLDINRFEKEELYKKRNITSAIFLLDQNINRIEFFERLKDIIVEFNNLTIEEKDQLKHWLVNANLKEKNFKNDIEKIFNANKKEVYEMTSNISRGLEKLKEEGIKEGVAKGKEEGKIEGKIEDIIEILTDIGSISESLKEKICNQTDIEVLKLWIKLAARCETIDEFETKAKLRN